MARQPANSLPVAEAVRNARGLTPNCLYVYAPDLPRDHCEKLAKAATTYIRAITPKLSGRGAAGIKPFFGAGYFGIKWDRSYLWHQETGTRAFTMRNLAGRVIPMWIDDPTGAERRKNPKAKTRITMNGRKQILIFRKAAKPGQRKKVAVRDRAGRLVGWRDVPASYPGAPGRIARTTFNEVTGSHTGRIAKLVPRPHSGVRWRNPGVVGRHYMEHGLQSLAHAAGVRDATIYATYRRA